MIQFFVVIVKKKYFIEFIKILIEDIPEYFILCLEKQMIYSSKGLDYSETCNKKNRCKIILKIIFCFLLKFILGIENMDIILKNIFITMNGLYQVMKIVKE